jgi:hypothetical protein
MLAHKEAFNEYKVYECAKAKYYQEEKGEDTDDEIDLSSDICIEKDWCGTKVVNVRGTLEFICAEPSIYVSNEDLFLYVVVFGALVVCLCFCIKISGGMGKAIKAMKSQEEA